MISIQLSEKEVAKALLVGKSIGYRYTFELKKNESFFWRVECSHAQYDITYSWSQPWVLDHVFDISELSEAVTYVAAACGPEDRFEDDGKKRYKIEFFHFTKINNKGDEKKVYLTQYLTVPKNKNEYILDYEERSGGFAYGLCKIPHTYYKMREGMVPPAFSYEFHEEPSGEGIVGFMYRGAIFKYDGYIPDQKCALGYVGDEKNRMHDDYSVKVEVWDVDEFYKKDHVYFLDYRDQLYYNQEIIPHMCCDGYLSDKEVKRVKEIIKGKIKGIHRGMDDAWL